jgi:hypothetical protein
MTPNSITMLTVSVSSLTWPANLRTSDKLYLQVCPFPLPPPGEYSAGIVFSPKAYGNAQAAGKKINEDAIAKFGQKLLGCRVVPVRTNEGKGLGATALSCESFNLSRGIILTLDFFFPVHGVPPFFLFLFHLVYSSVWSPD